MDSLGKKILAAFVEITDKEKTTSSEEIKKHVATPVAASTAIAGANEKFNQYFDKLFSEANIPGPDYYEFSKMTEAMMAIADEKARYNVAFAGLSVQGLDKTKLLHTAGEYLSILEKDEANFDNSVDAALKEKVEGKNQEIANRQQRITQLTKEISDLQNQVQLLRLEVKESEEKIESNTGGYKLSSGQMKQRIQNDIDKIRQYIAG